MIEARISTCKSVVDNTVDFLTAYIKDQEQPVQERWVVLTNSGLWDKVDKCVLTKFYEESSKENNENKERLSTG